MIARRFRFHGYNALTPVYRKGRTVRTADCTLKAVRNDRRGAYRAAVVVSRKLSKSAVVRNRVRRRIYEQVRGLVPPDAPYDLVFSAFDAELATKSEKHINAMVSKLLQGAGIGSGQGTVDNSARSEKTYKNI